MSDQVDNQQLKPMWYHVMEALDKQGVLADSRDGLAKVSRIELGGIDIDTHLSLKGSHGWAT